MKKETSEKINMIMRSIFVGILVLIALIGPSFLKHDPYQVNMANAFSAPCGEFLCGTDNLGRCVFCRMIAGAGTSLFSALLVVVVVFCAGTLIGCVAGYAGGIADEILMKITLIFQAFPSFILAVCVAGILGVGLFNGILSLCAVYWTTYAKLARSLMIQQKQQNYVYAARMNGASHPVIVLKYLLPNIMGNMVVTASMDVGSVILSMAGLSFLGLGAVRPTAEWGAVMSEARNYLQTAPWIIVFNGIALFITVAAFQLWGDSLRDFMNRSNKGRQQ